MNVAEWRALPKAERRLLWQQWTPEQRLDMFNQLAVTTPGYALPYPDDYNDPADSPLAFRELAIATDNALILLRDGKADAGHTHSDMATKSYVDQQDAKKANSSHTHSPSQVGFKMGRFGVGSVGAGNTITKTVAHGLGKTPTIAIATCYADTGEQSGVVSVHTMDSVNVVWKIGNLNSSSSESLDVSWLVA